MILKKRPSDLESTLRQIYNLRVQGEDETLSLEARERKLEDDCIRDFRNLLHSYFPSISSSVNVVYTAKANPQLEKAEMSRELGNEFFAKPLPLLFLDTVMDYKASFPPLTIYSVEDKKVQGSDKNQKPQGEHWRRKRPFYSKGPFKSKGRPLTAAKESILIAVGIPSRSDRQNPNEGSHRNFRGRTRTFWGNRNRFRNSTGPYTRVEPEEIENQGSQGSDSGEDLEVTQPQANQPRCCFLCNRPGHSFRYCRTYPGKVPGNHCTLCEVFHRPLPCNTERGSNLDSSDRRYPPQGITRRIQRADYYQDRRNLNSHG